MGIWKVREKEMAKVNAERADLKKKYAQFNAQKGKLIKAAVQKSAKQFEVKMKALKAREKKIEQQAEKRIAQATRIAHSAEQLKSRSQMAKFERKMAFSLKKQIKSAESRAKIDARTKYNKEYRSLKSVMLQFKGERNKLTRDNIKLNEHVERLQKQIDEKITPQVEGLLNEKELMGKLQKLFPDDKFVNTGKGGDILQSIIKENQPIGVIVYECKKVKNYASKFVKQTYDAQHKRKADFGVLVTNAMKKGTNGFCVERGVIVIHSTGVLYIAGILRRQIVQISEMKLGQAEREKAVKGILVYLESPEFTNSVDSIVQDSVALYKQMVDEVRKHIKSWKERYALYSRINIEANAIQGNTKALLSGKDKQEKKISNLPALAPFPEVYEEPS